ncbi:MAG: hypothetical protein QXQ29_05210 [Candidatus Bathyarchaeia archaeon]
MSEADSQSKVYVGYVKPQVLDTCSKIGGRIFVGRITFRSFGRVGRIKVLLDGCKTET